MEARQLGKLVERIVNWQSVRDYIMERDAKDLQGNQPKEKKYAIDHFDNICEFYRRSGATDKNYLYLY